jgi:hypothetical protein
MLLVGFSVFVSGYDGGAGYFDGGSSDGNVDSANPYCRLDSTSEKCQKDPENWDNPPACSDGEDNNGLYGQDYAADTWDGDGSFTEDVDGDGVQEGDPGCSSPYDRTESVTWDTDMTSAITMAKEGLNAGTQSIDWSSNPSVLFKGAVRTGNAFEGVTIGQSIPDGGDPAEFSLPETTSSNLIIERRMPDPGAEVAQQNYGSTGFDGNPPDSATEISIGSGSGKLPQGAVLLDGRIVDPPVDPDSVTGSNGYVGEGSIEPRTCGDGMYNPADNELDDGGEPFTGELISSNYDATHHEQYFNSRRKSSFVLDCPEDYGQLMLQPFHFDTGDDSDIDSGITGSTVYGQDGLECRDDEVGSETTTGPDGESSTDYFVETSYSQDEDNDYWEMNGEKLTRYKCEKDPTESLEAGDARRWEVDREEECNDNNLVNGGQRVSGQEQGTQMENRPSNDVAATYTDFKAYTESGDVETVWCAFAPDDTLTVDADGPQGGGDGFVVVKDGGGVIGTRSPGQSGDTGEVGQQVYTKTYGESLTDSGDNFLDKTRGTQWDTDCPKSSTGDTSNYCIKYLDFYTNPNRNDWDTASSRLEGAVEVDKAFTITPDMSYSACKFINKVSQDTNGHDVRNLDCDYESGDPAGSGDMSPLSGPCGDQDNEDLVMAEGNQVNFRFLSNELYQSQKCIHATEDDDSNNVGVPSDDEKKRTLTEDACSLGGVGYAEGTVLNVTSLGKKAERGEYSPDFEVCLNPTGAELEFTGAVQGDNVKWDNNKNNIGNSDAGGEWYDLDNERVRTYIRGKFDADAYEASSEYSNQPVNRIETYMRENPNPQHPQYNPTGGETGLVMEDDCGNPERDFVQEGLTNDRGFGSDDDSGCEDQSSNPSVQERFYTFFNRVLSP